MLNARCPNGQKKATNGRRQAECSSEQRPQKNMGPFKKSEEENSDKLPKKALTTNMGHLIAPARLPGDTCPILGSPAPLSTHLTP